MEHTELQILNGVFSSEIRILLRVLPHIYVEIIKFYFNKYRNAKWQDGLISYG